jgi:hypothetical protein
MESIILQFGGMIATCLFFTGNLHIWYFHIINSYPADKCINLNYHIRWRLFPYTKRNTAKGVPREIFALKMYQLISLGIALLVWAVLFFVVRKYYIQWVIFYAVITPIFAIGYSIRLEWTIFLYRYKRLNRENWTYLFREDAVRSPKRDLGEAEIVSTYKKKRKKYAKVLFRNKIYKDVLLICKRSASCHLYERMGVYWLEEETRINCVYIEDLLRIINEEKDDYCYYLDCKEWKFVPVFQGYDTFAVHKERYVKVPRLILIGQYSDIEEGWFLEEHDMFEAERWCRLHHIPYCYRRMEKEMPAH